MAIADTSTSLFVDVYGYLDCTTMSATICTDDSLFSIRQLETGGECDRKSDPSTGS